MAKQYEASRAINRMMSLMARLGLGRTELMATTGRKTGAVREVPVSPIVVEGVEYVVAPYGAVGWVRNVRANPEVGLRLGSRTRRVRLEELDGVEAAPVVAAYHRREGFARRYMDAPEEPTLEDFVARSGGFPVFRVVATEG